MSRIVWLSWLCRGVQMEQMQERTMRRFLTAEVTGHAIRPQGWTQKMMQWTPEVEPARDSSH